jgi:hypothetical protein
MIRDMRCNAAQRLNMICIHLVADEAPGNHALKRHAAALRGFMLLAERSASICCT